MDHSVAGVYAHETRVVTAYLNVLATRRRHKHHRTKRSLLATIAELEAEIATTTNPLRRLALIQTRTEREAELRTVPGGDLENQFVAIAAGYAARKQMDRAAWRQLGVPGSVLRRAGITE